MSIWLFNGFAVAYTFQQQIVDSTTFWHTKVLFVHYEWKKKWAKFRKVLIHIEMFAVRTPM